ncbi:glutamyl aminopeptidase-like [Haliotis rufescens]|uniref:glutamyl aminopeptidase-like n=1 Tax=Haliotis rufescens TaxID=6454 RepID=UPI00201F248A|nr:glutamyl aminopeptidase-like [Haliotis rufescens]
MDCNDKYPDVTIAEQRPLTNANNVGTKETVVTLRQPRDKGCYMSRFQVGILCSFLILVIVIITLLVLFFGTEVGCFCYGISRGPASSAQGQTQKTNTRLSNVTDNLPFGTATNLTNPGHRKCVCINGSHADNHGLDSTIFPTQTPTVTNSLPPWRKIRLPRDLVPSFYEVQLTVDLTHFIYRGSVNISVRVVKATSFVMFHRNAIDIIERTVQVLPIGDQYPARKIKRQFYDNEYQFHVAELDGELPAGSEYVIQVAEYDGHIRDNLTGLYFSSYKTKEGRTRYLASSQLQPIDARKVFPCFDEPDFKAIFKVTIIHQPGYQALCNMPLYRSSVLNNGWLKKEFDPTPIMSTYILAFVVADFKSRNYSFNNGYQLRIWARPDAYSQTKHALEFGVKTYNFFTEFFNTSDVVPKADHVAVPDFSGGAMENWGLVIYRETALLYDPQVSSSSNKYMVTLIMAHEIAHTWFGNMVTMKWWDDLWLNEGFASILMFFAMDNAYPEWNVFAIQVVEYMFPAMVKDALVTSHPVSADIEDPNDIHQSFDIISYNKGMAVLRMLQGFIGWKSFKEGLQLYVRRYKFKNAERDELWQTFTEAVNNTYIVKKIMDTWTRQTGYPVVNVRTVNNTFILDQERFLLNQEEADPLDDNPFGYRWYIPFTYIIQYDRDVRKVWLNMEAATINRTEGWLLGNVDYMGFFRVNYEKDMWMRLGGQLLYNHTVFPEANRAGLIGDAFALARANLLDYDIALNLTRYLKSELSYVPWQAFVDSIEVLRGMIATKEAYVYLQQYLRDLVAPVYNTATYVKGTLPDKYLHRIILGMACDVGVENAVSYAKSTFNAWKKYNTILASDVSVLIYSVGIREGGTDEWDFVWEKAQSTSVASEKEMMMEALAQTQKPWLLWRYANWVFDPNKIKKQDVRVVMSYFTKTPLARSVALQFFMTRWKDLVSRFGHDPFILPEVIPTVTSYVNSEFHLRQLETIFKETPPKTASKAAENALALTRSNIKWMETYYEKIAVWLKDNVT